MSTFKFFDNEYDISIIPEKYAITFVQFCNVERAIIERMYAYMSPLQSDKALQFSKVLAKWDQAMIDMRYKLIDNPKDVPCHNTLYTAFSHMPIVTNEYSAWEYELLMLCESWENVTYMQRFKIESLETMLKDFTDFHRKHRLILLDIIHEFEISKS
jgi:hypothetical protein